MTIIADGGKEGRFQTVPPCSRPTPAVAGLCAACLRPMWTAIPQGDRAGKLIVSGDGRHCEPCSRFIRTQGTDPRCSTRSPAEQVPAERPEGDQSWRDPALTRCAGAGVDAFGPDPMPDEGTQTTSWELRRYVAAFVCGACPVAARCRAAARVHGYEGMWGGRFFAREVWTDPLTGAQGPTVHTPERLRRQLLSRLAKAGYDEDGEKIDRSGAA